MNCHRDGAVGFIGFHVAAGFRKTAGRSSVSAISTFITTRRPKQARLAELKKLPGFSFVKLDFAERAGMTASFKERRFEHVVHLARRQACAILARFVACYRGYTRR